MRTTHTFAKLLVSKSAFDEISAKLKAADYAHAFLVDGVIPLIDMTGIAITPDLTPQCQPTDLQQPLTPTPNTSESTSPSTTVSSDGSEPKAR